jgi:hypothetical protein
MSPQYRKPTPYEIIMSAFTLQDVAEPVRLRLDASMPFEEAQFEYALMWPSLVLLEESGRPSGYVIGDELDPGGAEREPGLLVGDLLLPFEMGQLIPGDTPLFEGLSFIDEKLGAPLFLLDRTGGIIAHINKSFLDHSPFRICLFTLLSQLEENLRDLVSLCAEYPVGDAGTRIGLQAILGLMSPKTINRFVRRYGHQPSGLGGPPFHSRYGDLNNLLRLTPLSELNELILSTPEISRHLPFATEGDAEAFLTLARKTRNEVAHGDNVGILHSLSELLDFVARVDHANIEISQLVNYELRYVEGRG